MQISLQNNQQICHKVYYLHIVVFLTDNTTTHYHFPTKAYCIVLKQMKNKELVL